MRQLKPVIWSKGTALAPQHLQNQDRFFESSLQFRLETLSFRPWGFSTLEIDHVALSSGSFNILRASGILPDGLLFDIPDSDAAPPAKPLEDAFEVDTDQADIYLAIPEYKDRGLNVSADGVANVRYRAETGLLRDETTGLSERPVQLAKKNFRFLTGGELREGVTALQAARVKRMPAGDFVAQSGFVPPLINLHASQHLRSITRRLVELLAAKSSQLSDQRRHKNQILADFTASDVPNFWLLYTINSFLPVLNHVFVSESAHPETLFNAMLSMAGALTTFSKVIQPRDLPAYDHANLSECFDDLDEKLRTLLETVVPANFVALGLKLIQPSIYATALAEDRYLAGTDMYLAINANMNHGDLIAKVPHLVKVCSANHIEHLIRQALPGVTLTHTPTPPASIPMKLNFKYFSLSQSGLAWEAIGRSRNLAAYVPADFPNPEIELVISFRNQ
jgi:type VI secretion system protein ImpJ